MAQWTVTQKTDGVDSLLAALRSAWPGMAGGHEIRLRVRGDSMLPGLPGGSAVVVRQGQQDIAPGSLIAYRLRGDLIVHRVIAVRRGRVGRIFHTKGDNNAGADAPVPERDVLGRVVAVEPAAGQRQGNVRQADRGAGGRPDWPRRLGLR